MSDASVLFYEGYLRNRKRLCTELSVEDSHDRERTEQSVLLAGYARWGRDVVHHLYGSFSFALREAGGKLFCARDHFGIKSFYYTCLPDGRLICAADISGITADPGYRKAIDPDALQLYMMFGYPAGEATLFRGIRKLMPGCMLTWDAGVCNIEQYYRPTFHPEYGVSEQAWIDRFDATLQEIFDDDRAAMGLGDGSAFLSGGVDSALLLAASGVKRAASVRFRESAYSEWEAASETAAWLGRELQGITLSAEEYLDAIPRYLRNAELPTTDSCVTAFLLGCEHTGGKGGPWLSGEGADEFFAGYKNYRLAPKLAWDDGSTHLGLIGIMPQEDARRLLGQRKACPTEYLVRDLYAQTAHDEHLSRLLLIDIRLWLEGDILFSVNRSARANGVELLLPYADRRMFELSAAIPSDLKWHDGCGKYILRRTAERWLPHDIAFRPKLGFMNPLRHWFLEDAFRPRIEKVLFGKVSAQFFDQAILRRYWDGLLNGEDLNWNIVYAAYVFAVWYECCYEKL